MDIGIELDARVVEVVEGKADERGNEDGEVKPEMDSPGPVVVLVVQLEDREIEHFAADKYNNILQREEYQEEPLMGEVVSLELRGFKLPEREDKPDVGDDVDNL